MVILAICSILAGTNLDHTSRTQCSWSFKTSISIQMFPSKTMLATGNKAKEECEWYGATRAVMHNSEELAAMRWALSNGVASLWIGTNCIKIGLPGKLILGDYFQENMTSWRPFLLVKISFPRRPIFIPLTPGLQKLPAFVGHQCENETCNGKLKWDDGSLYSFDPSLIPIRVDNLSDCMIYYLDAFSEFWCSKSRIVLCQIKCDGK